MFRFLAALLLLAAPSAVPAALKLTASSPSFSIADITCTEGGAPCVVTIIKSAPAKSWSRLTVSTADGTAKAGTDYQPVSVILTFGDSQLSQRVTIPIVNDSSANPARSLTVSLTGVRNARISRSPATVTILDDDIAPPPPPTGIWTKCADENGTCTVSGTANVRYGSGATWTAPRSVSGSIACDNMTWGDPLVGTVKECDTDGTVAPAPPPPLPTPTPTPTPTPAPSGKWVSAPLTVGGYACNAISGTGNTPPCGLGIVYRITGTVESSDAIPVTLYQTVFYTDVSGQFPLGDAFARAVASSWTAAELQGLAPAR